MSEDISIKGINQDLEIPSNFENKSSKNQKINPVLDDESAYYEKEFNIDDFKSELPGYIYYKGERISEFDFLKNAYEEGEIELDETKSAFDNFDMAWDKLIQDNAKPLFDWSTSLYSEDGMYKFRVENGVITGATLAANSDGTKWIDIAYQLASGKLPNELSIDIMSFAHTDYELFEASRNIGDMKRIYNYSTNQYNAQKIDYKEYINSLEPLILALLGQNKTVDKLNPLPSINAFYAQEAMDYAKSALENYDKNLYKKALANATIY